MPTDPIVQLGDPVLRNGTRDVPPEMFGTKELHDIIERMKAVLAGEPHGAALAAPQIGEPWRIFIVAGSVALGTKERDKETGTIDVNGELDPTAPPPPELVCINPTLVKLSRKKEEMEEGCLSVRGQFGTVTRAPHATVQAFSEDGTKFERGASGLLAQAFQHEIDHLDGILFIDRATAVWDHDEKKHDE